MQAEPQDWPNLYLVGFMGTGKSAAGRGVAERLGLRYVDSDAEIEARLGMPVTQIFAERGEAAFREEERRFITEGHPATGCVISTGGGLITVPGLREAMTAKGILLCLFASRETILERTARNQNRPLLQTDDPAAKIEALLDERLPLYRKCPYGVLTDHRPIAEVVRQICRQYLDAMPAHAAGSREAKD
jgi:shikimate kinase